jgi:hypothetical protein
MSDVFVEAAKLLCAGDLSLCPNQPGMGEWSSKGQTLQHFASIMNSLCTVSGCEFDGE